MKLRKLLRQRGLGLNLIAGFCFLMLAVYGWGLSWRDLGLYLVAMLLFLLGLMLMAALCGYLLRRIMARKKNKNKFVEHSDKGRGGSNEPK